MVQHITDDDSASIEDRILFAFIEQYNDRYPNYGLEPDLQDLLRSFFKMAFDIGATNTLEQTIEFVKQMRDITKSSVGSKRALVDVADYLMNHKFEYKHKHYEQHKARTIERDRADNSKRGNHESCSKPGGKKIHQTLGSDKGT